MVHLLAKLFKNTISLHFSIPVLKIHAGHTHDFLDRDGSQSTTNFCYNNKFKKIRVIENLNYSIAKAVNSEFQSKFSKAFVGCVDCSYYCQNIHAPASSIITPNTLYAGGIFGNPIVINNRNAVHPATWKLPDHRLIVDVSFVIPLEVRKSAVVSRDIETIRQPNRNARTPPITAITFTFILYFHPLCQEFEPDAISGHLFFPSRAVPRHYLLRALDLQNNHKQQKIVRKNILNQGLINPEILLPHLRLNTCNSKEKQKASHLTTDPHQHLYCNDQTVFTVKLKLGYLQRVSCFRYIMLTVFSQQKYDKKHYFNSKWEFVSLIELDLNLVISYSETISLPITYFLGERKYPLSLTMVPSNLVPLSHPSLPMSLSGTTIVYLYFVFPLYSYAFAFCIIIKLSMQKPIYKYGTIKFIYSYYIIDIVTCMNEKNSNIKEMINARKARGMILLEQGFEPQAVNKSTWIIPSQTGNGTYSVRYFKSPSSHWICTCKDFELRGLPCKHITAVKIWKNLREKFEQLHIKVRQTINLQDENTPMCCKHCHSTDFYRYGKKNGKQVYKCKSCNRKFVNNVDFENMKYNPKIIALTLDLYFRGLSLRKISSHLKQFYNLDVTHMSIYNWIEKYIWIMNEYVNTIQPDIGQVWHTDEMMVNIHGSWEYLWNIIDEKTRYQLASVVSTERKIRDARMVFQKAKKNCGGRKPKYVVTDGLHSYRGAINKEFNTSHGETEHLWNVGLQHHPNNNHVERLHGTIREREKTMRGLKVEDTPIIEGHRLYYNYIKPHMALEGKTPSEEAGISIEGDNKWLTLMQNAVKYQKGYCPK